MLITLAAIATLLMCVISLVEVIKRIIRFVTKKKDSFAANPFSKII